MCIFLATWQQRIRSRRTFAGLCASSAPSSFERGADLDEHWQYFYARTMGCVGLLKEWLTKSLAAALATKKQVLTPEILERYAMSLDRCDQMLRDIEEGEQLLAHDPAAEGRLWFRLGLGTCPSNGLEHINSANKKPDKASKAPRDRARTRLGSAVPGVIP